MRLFLLLLLALPAVCFSQRNKDEEEVLLTGFKQYGYVGGLRIDTINVKYATVQITAGMAFLAGNAVKRFDFEYGQQWKNEREVRISDATGKVITFNSTAAALNFFDYNGWDLVQIFYGVGNGGQSILLRKKQ